MRLTIYTILLLGLICVAVPAKSVSDIPLHKIHIVALASAPKHAPEPLVAGYIEDVSVTIADDNISAKYPAKLDTGADSSSMHATDIVINKKKRKVTFTVTDQNGRDHRVTMPYTRLVRIKKRPSGYQRRAVVAAQIKIGDRILTAEVNLTDRSSFAYKLLIGRKELRRGIVVDPSRKYILSSPTH